MFHREIVGVARHLIYGKEGCHGRAPEIAGAYGQQVVYVWWDAVHYARDSGVTRLAGVSNGDLASGGRSAAQVTAIMLLLLGIAVCCASLPDRAMHTWIVRWTG